MAAHGRTLGRAAVMAVGSYLDKVSLVAQAYPAWVYKFHAFWLYRLCTQPRLMWRRYLLGGPRFVFRLLQARSAG